MEPLQLTKEVKQMFVSLMIVSIIVFMYGSYRCKHPTYKDPLENKIGIMELDGWSLSHFVTFLFIGLVFNDINTIKLAVIFGLMWELFEHLRGKHRPGWLGGYGGTCAKISENNEEGNWWYGKVSDIFVNILGIMIGQCINNSL